MKVLVRKTLTGTEYWDTKAKKTLFVPTGVKPDFEVTDNPDSMIGNEPEITNTREPGDGINLEDMNAEQLLAFAEQTGIDVPGTVKKEETIRKYITNAMTDAQ